MPKTCSESSAPLRRLQLHGPTMGTRWAISCDVPARLDANELRRGLAQVVEQVDTQMSPWKPGSALNRLNRAPAGSWLTLPAELMEVLARALDVCRQSEGAFDPAVGALVDAWGFGAARAAPDAEAIRIACSTARPPTHQALELDPTTGCARKHAALQLDLCGIAKGYAVDGMCAVLEQRGVRHALVALDGELRAIGTQASGTPWAVALESPRADMRAAQGVIELQDLAVATSGDYRHFVQVGQASLAHSMDGRSGRPVNNGVASVTVLAPRCMDADAWATALLVAGPGQGLALAHRHGLEALWLLRRGQALVELGSGRFAAAAPVGTA